MASGAVGESIKGDLDQEFSESHGRLRFPRTWYGIRDRNIRRSVSGAPRGRPMVPMGRPGDQVEMRTGRATARVSPCCPWKGRDRDV